MTATHSRSVRWVAGVASALAVAASLYHLYAAYFYPFFALTHRSVHWLFMGSLIFLAPLMRRDRRPGWPQALYSLLFLGLTWAGGLYVITHFSGIASRAGAYSRADILFGLMTLVAVVEAARRSTGWAVPAVALAFVVYAFAGPYLPVAIGHRGYSFARVMPYLSLTTNGIFGIPLGVSAQFILLFILYGAILERTGAGRFFLDLAMSLAGGTRGGPAKAAVVASTFMGMVSGSSVANTVTTGTFTIPLMKRLGFRPEMAGGVEASASTMGQVMPPIMGAAAFLLAEYIGVPYLKVAVAATIPALLALFSMFVQVDFYAAGRGLVGLPRQELPHLGRTLREGGHFLIPMAALFYFLVGGYSPERAVFWTILLTVADALVVAARRGELRRTLAAIVDGLQAGAANTAQVAAICAAAGIIIGVTTLTGLGLRVSSLVVSLAGGNLWIAAAAAMVASLILGAGIPTTATYVILATLVAPAFVKMGVAILPAHLFIFYFGAVADITPPVAVAGYAAAGIARSDPFRTGVEAFRMGLAKYVVPFLLFLSPALMLDGSWGEIALAAAMAAAGVVAMSGALQGYLAGRSRWFERLELAVAAALLFRMQPRFAAVGLALVVLIAVAQWRRGEGPVPSTATASEMTAKEGS
ncbi:TRAP transporter permease [Limnochorda pilosa]|uniref:C4-dicarboxylate ABC transporter n=1 Tax=Limnochorda pilosa TaxID=1555112 RepID=A0A0K2SI39_LIMPI|nr:TRAP transporter permease [Limnochorda pilosa]BAS26514.1 C4-dicarboxylate ABC transporter [Limnochorda pilosa]